MATILTKKKDTTGAPSAGDLTNSTGGAELAVNTADKRLYTKNSGGSVVEVGTNPGEAVTFVAGSASTPAITTTGDTNTGIFFPAADTIAFAEGGAEAMRIDSSGNVGIGTTTPGSFTAGLNKLVVGSGSGENGMTVYSGTANSGYYAFADGTSGSEGYRGYVQYAHSIDTMVFATAAAERMRIDSSGRVGIGTSSPATDAQLTISAELEPILFFQRAQAGNNDAAIHVTSGGAMLFKNGVDSSTAAGLTERARITSGGYFKASNTGSYINSTASFHEFRNDNAITEALIVNATNASYTGDAFFVRTERTTTNNTYYAINFYNGSEYRFRVADSGNVTNTNNSYGSISDVKLKQDIVDAGSQWNDIKNLRVRKYRWKSDPDGFLQMGLVAQEAEEVSPGLVEEHLDYEEVTKTREVEKTRVVTEAVLDEDGNEIEPAVTETYTEEEEYTERVATGTVTKAVKYSILYMKAVKALQEAMERIETLEAKVAALETK